MSQSIKVNFVFNIINTINGLIFPLVTFPYVARVIMAEGIGEVNFFNSILNYIVLFSSIGIPMYGIREIARVRDDKKKLSTATIEILSLHIALNFIGYIGVAIICLTVVKVQVNIPLFLLLSTSIIMNTIGCQWFYNGVEEFKLITILGLLVSIVSITFLYTFVKTENDLMWYGVYTILGGTGKNIFNFFWLKRYISIQSLCLHDIHPLRHLKPSLQIFAFNLMTSIYINLDSVMLGFIKDVSAVGYYTVATKISHILVVAVSSVGNVLLPRASNLVKNNLLTDFYTLTKKAFAFIEIISFPICAGVILLAPILIHLFGGEAFTPSINTLRFLAPTIIAISLSQITGIQILYPLGKINIVTLSTCIGAFVNICFNMFLIPLYAQNGAAVATSIAEICVTITQVILVRKYLPFKLLDKGIFKYILASLLMYAVCTSVTLLPLSDIVLLIVIPIIGVIVYIGILLALGDIMCRKILVEFKIISK